MRWSVPYQINAMRFAVLAFGLRKEGLFPGDTAQANALAAGCGVPGGDLQERVRWVPKPLSIPLQVEVHTCISLRQTSSSSKTVDHIVRRPVTFRDVKRCKAAHDVVMINLVLAVILGMRLDLVGFVCFDWDGHGCYVDGGVLW